jgi:hypothetical protein
MTRSTEMGFPFDQQKATEVATQFLKLEKGSINVMKLVKLIYLLDRESIRQRGIPVIGGAYLSMKNGPVTSEILDLINSGSLWNCETNWERFISDRQGHIVELSKDPGTEHLSEFELALIGELFAKHQKHDQWAMRDWCHVHCGEWLPLQEGREHISLAKLAEEVGRDPLEVLENAAEQTFLDEVFG